MSRLTLSVCLSRNPMTAAILDGQVTAEGIDFVTSAVHPSEMFWRQLKYGDFDISEMSLASLMIAAAQGRRDWTALPVFTTRRFFHTGIIVRDDAGIDAPSDLAGRRVGVPEYQQTAAVWARGALEHEFGVRPQDMHWFMERPPWRSHGGVTEFRPPDGLRFDYIDADTSIARMLAEGSLDAALVYISQRNLVDRSERAASTLHGVRPLFADAAGEGQRYLAATGILPVNHTVVVRSRLLAGHPWVALNVYAAFVAAKRASMEALFDEEGEIGRPGGSLQPWMRLCTLPADVTALMQATDPLPYGLRAQRRVLEVLAGYLLEQGLLSAPLDPLDLFAPSTRDL